MFEKPNYYDRQIGRGGKEFARPQSRINEFANLDNATLDEIIATEYFIPREIDIDRITTASRVIARNRGDIISIADLGGGKGTLDTLIAKSFYEQGKIATVTDIDINKEKLEKAATVYQNIPGLHFLNADISKIKLDDFDSPPQIVIASWIHGGQEQIYKEAIKKINPYGIFEIADFDRETTENLYGLPGYSRLAYWHGPTTANIGYNYSHFNNKLGSTQGDNMITLLIRDDILQEEQTLKEALECTKTKKQYPWERDLEEINPPIDYPLILTPN